MFLVEDVHARDIGREQIGCELESTERAVDGTSDRLGQHGLADTGNVLYQHVAFGHERNERRVWVVIGLCTLMMLVEIVGGLMFGSIALVADGLHPSSEMYARWVERIAAHLP